MFRGSQGRSREFSWRSNGSSSKPVGIPCSHRSTSVFSNAVSLSLSLSRPALPTHESIFNSTPLPELIPRLFPFFRHTITSVRHSVLNTVAVFLELPTLDPSTWVDSRLYRLLFQNILLEQRPEIRRASQEAFHKTLSLATRSPSALESLTRDVSPSLSTWFTLLRSPIGTPLNAALFWSARESLAGNGVGIVHNVDKPMLNQDLALVSTESVLKGKVEAAKAVGNLMTVWPKLVRLRGSLLRPSVDSQLTTSRCRSFSNQASQGSSSKSCPLLQLFSAYWSPHSSKNGLQCHHTPSTTLPPS